MFYVIRALNKRKQSKATRVEGYTKSWCLILTSNCSLGVGLYNNFQALASLEKEISDVALQPWTQQGKTPLGKTIAEELKCHRPSQVL